MRAKMLFTFFIAFTAGHCSFGQTSSVEIEKIKNFIARIDSLIDDDSPQIGKEIADGLIKKEVVVIKTVSGRTIRSKPTFTRHGFSKTTYYKRDYKKADTVYKINYHDNLDNNYNESFYYDNNKLVAAIVSINGNKNTPVLFSKTEYYKDDKLVFNSIYNPSNGNGYSKRIPSSFFEKGVDTLKEFLARTRR
jgi:hypothetical protein